MLLPKRFNIYLTVDTILRSLQNPIINTTKMNYLIRMVVFINNILFIKAMSIVQIGNKEEINNNLGNCANNIIDSYRYSSYAILSLNKSSIPNSLLTNGAPVTLINLEENYKLGKYYKVDFYLSICGSVSELETIFKSVERKFHPSTKYIIIYNGEENLDDLFDTCMDYKVVNVVVIQNNKLFTYFPYENSCGGNYKAEMIGECFGNATFYPDKVPLNLHGCEIRLLALFMIPYVININSTKNAGKIKL